MYDHGWLTIGLLSSNISTSISEAFCLTSSQPILSKVLVKYCIGEVLVKYWRGIGELKTIGLRISQPTY